MPMAFGAVDLQVWAGVTKDTDTDPLYQSAQRAAVVTGPRIGGPTSPMTGVPD
jgi:hypothetical protein